jgi:hypothetical protein
MTTGRCFDTHQTLRCEKPLGHAGNHVSGHFSWWFAPVPKPRWFDRLGAKDLTGRVPL